MNSLRSNIEWKLWGRDDPLYGVVNWHGKQKGSRTAWTDDEFYALGKSDWNDFFRQWQQYGVNRESCIEVGCGAGRITKQLVSAFDRVYAVDISENQLNYARARIKAENVEFSIIDGRCLPYPNCSVKSIFSSYVLQHLDNIEIGFAYFREFFRVLDFGGTMMVQLPLYQWPTSDELGLTKLMKAVYKLRLSISNLRAEVKRLTCVKTMRATPYPMNHLYDILTDAGYKGIEIRLFRAASDGSLQSFVFATK